MQACAQGAGNGQLYKASRESVLVCCRRDRAEIGRPLVVLLWIRIGYSTKRRFPVVTSTIEH